MEGADVTYLLHAKVTVPLRLCYNGFVTKLASGRVVIANMSLSSGRCQVAVGRPAFHRR
jgi:hypothetical protein